MNDDTGKRLGEMRRFRHFTQSDLADKMDVSRQIISSWENGKSIPLNRMKQLCRELDVEVDYFYSQKLQSAEQYVWVLENVRDLKYIVNRTVHMLPNEKRESGKDYVMKSVRDIVSGLYQISISARDPDAVYKDAVSSLDAVRNYIRMVMRDKTRSLDIEARAVQKNHAEMDQIEFEFLKGTAMAAEEASEIELIYKDGQNKGKIKDWEKRRLQMLLSPAGFRLLTPETFSALKAYLEQSD